MSGTREIMASLEMVEGDGKAGITQEQNNKRDITTRRREKEKDRDGKAVMVSLGWAWYRLYTWVIILLRSKAGYPSLPPPAMNPNEKKRNQPFWSFVHLPEQDHGKYRPPIIISSALLNETKEKHHPPIIVPWFFLSSTRTILHHHVVMSSCSHVVSLSST